MNEASPASPLAYTGILSECRDLLLDRLSSALTGSLQEMDRELQQKRGAAGMGQEALTLVDAQFYLRAAAPNLERSLRRAFERSFRERVAKRAADARRYDGLQFNEKDLSLLDEASFAESLAVQQLAKRLTSAAAAELKELQPRIATLMGNPELESSKDPLGPDAVCEALKEVCWDMGSSAEVRTVLLEQLISTVSKSVPDAYDELNAHLDRRNVPGPARGIRRERSNPATKTPADAAQKTEGAGQAGGTPGGGAGSGDSAGDAASSGPQVQPELGGFVKSLFSGGELPPLPAAEPAEGVTAISSGEAMQLLTQLQRGEQASIAGSAGPISFAPPASPTTNVIHGLREGGLGRHLQPVDNVIIDVVATLFDHIFDDKRVPEAVKGLIGRLQIPLLKLAMMDHGFLSNNRHPARLFINRLAEAAASCGTAFTTESELYQTSEKLVLRVQHEFAEDSGVFKACIDELDAFLAEQQRKADAEAAALAAELEAKEREEHAVELARDTVAEPMLDTTLPEAVRHFIDDQWQQVLAQAAFESGEDSEAWCAALSTMELLVWSVRPKYGPEGRQLLIKELPKLLGGLRSGLEKGGTAPEERDAFFAQLVELHTTVMKKAGTPPPAGTKNDPPPAPRQPPKPVAAESTPGPAPEERPQGRGGIIQSHESPLDHIARGAWLNLRQDDGSTRSMRLGWISPKKTMYLFTDDQGQNAVALSRAQLEDRFAFGTVFAVDEDHTFIDRIVDHILTKYQQQPKAA